MKKWIVCVAAIALTVCGSMLAGHEPAQPPKNEKKSVPRPDSQKIKDLMAKKLEHSQKLLAALVTNDLEKAAKHADELQQIRKDPAWSIIKSDQYEIWSKEFTESTSKIIKASREKNLDAAKLGYLEMTQNCFHCHTYVRDQGDIRLLNLER
jgi:hypothetical protein